MIHRGKVTNGQIILDSDLALPEGAEVEIVVHDQLAEKRAVGGQSVLEALRPFVGAVDDLLPDMSTNHDHYLYGAAKRT